jgi:hypothetical protein
MDIEEWVWMKSSNLSWVVKAKDGGLYIREGGYEDWKERMPVPISCRRTILKDAHEHGHFGRRRTYERIKR